MWYLLNAWRSTLCERDDLACQEWERNERRRLERFLFDNGYLKGRAALAFACGKRGDDVDLHVYLRRGPTYRVGPMTITGNLFGTGSSVLFGGNPASVTSLTPTPTR